MNQVIKLLGLLTVIYLGFSREAYAYLDPGSGSYIVQMFIAAVVASLFAIKMFFAQIKDFFVRLFSKDKNSPPNEKSD